MSIFVLVANGLFLLQGALIFGASFGAFLGETPMILSGVLALALWGTFVGLMIYATTLAVEGMRGDDAAGVSAGKWCSALYLTNGILSIVTGLGLGFGAFASCGPLYLAPLYHWICLPGAALAFAAFFVYPCIAGTEGYRWWVVLLTCGGAALFWGLVWLIAWVILSGTGTLKYPDRATSKYKLPWPGGESAWVIQGNNSGLNHNGTQEYAYDFRRRCGTPLLAARGGTVFKVIQGNSGNGSDKPNNEIWIQHDTGDGGDTSVAKYFHFMQNSAKVKVNDRVTQGQQLASVGNVGNSLTGHIHFIVFDKAAGGKNIPTAFSDPDVKDDQGIPRTFHSYESANRK